MTKSAEAVPHGVTEERNVSLGVEFGARRRGLCRYSVVYHGAIAPLLQFLIFSF